MKEWMRLRIRDKSEGNIREFKVKKWARGTKERFFLRNIFFNEK